MEPVMLRSLVAVEAAPGKAEPTVPKPPSAPAKAVARSYPAVPQDEPIELEQLKRPAIPTSTSDNVTAADTRDLEMSRPSSPVSGGGSDGGVDIVQRVWDPYMNRFRLLSACLMSVGNGLNDSAPGALIPYMEKHYGIGYGTVSLIFVGNAFGFIFGALLMDSIRERLGRGKLLALSQTITALGYIPMVVAAPFPVIVIAFFMVGFGMSLNLAMGNTFCGSLQNSTTVLGAYHGAYGIGGTVGPLIATAIVTLAGAQWSQYYFLTLGLAAFNVLFSAWSFWGYEKDQARTYTLVSGNAPESPTARLSGMFTVFSSRVILLGAIFIFAYQGAEVSISGWVISFLITTRDGDPSSVGYVTAGFWAGITLGRFLLSTPAHRIGEKAFVYAVVVGAAVFELLVWLVPNVIGNAVAVSIVGLLLGPVYPCATVVFIRGMSRREQVSGLGVISAFGSSGGAAAPFTTGILAQAVGTFVLHPIAIGLFGVMIVCWYALPGRRKREE